MSWLPCNDPVLGDPKTCDALDLIIVPRTRDLATLSAMDDMMLKDIGVNRCQIRSAIESGADLKPLR